MLLSYLWPGSGTGVTTYLVFELCFLLFCMKGAVRFPFQFCFDSDEYSWSFLCSGGSLSFRVCECVEFRGREVVVVR